LFVEIGATGVVVRVVVFDDGGFFFYEFSPGAGAGEGRAEEEVDQEHEEEEDAEDNGHPQEPHWAELARANIVIVRHKEW